MKKAYKTPGIKTVELDKDISLQLTSDDPYKGPEKVRGNESQGSPRDPYQYDEWN